MQDWQITYYDSKSPATTVLHSIFTAQQQALVRSAWPEVGAVAALVGEGRKCGDKITGELILIQ
jgi:hypothetical protein